LRWNDHFDIFHGNARPTEEGKIKILGHDGNAGLLVYLSKKVSFEIRERETDNQEEKETIFSRYKAIPAKIMVGSGGGNQQAAVPGA
jgi:hypothetical protein